MTEVKLEKLSVKFEGIVIFDNLSISFPSKSVTSLLGYSGVGKTTILKIIAGINQIHSGNVCFDGQNISNIPIRELNVGYVPQSQMLFPNLNVEKNISYGLEARKMAKNSIESRVNEVAEIVGLTGLLRRKINNLSGGEKQRVALGRAIAPKPKILLLDEPLSSLDAPERHKMTLILKEIIQKLNITTLYVTHSVQEAEILSKRSIIFGGNQSIQIGNINQLRKNPLNFDIARLLGLQNVFVTVPEEFKIDPSFLKKWLHCYTT